SVASPSRQAEGPNTAGEQQFAVAGWHCRSMLGMHPLASHAVASLQLGPPSVARMTTVLPARPLNIGRSARSVDRVGVEPKAPRGALMAAAKALVTGPSPQAPLGSASPGRVENTSSPTAHGFNSLTSRPGKNAAPMLARGPRERTSAVAARATAAYF